MARTPRSKKDHKKRQHSPGPSRTETGRSDFKGGREARPSSSGGGAPSGGRKDLAEKLRSMQRHNRPERASFSEEQRSPAEEREPKRDRPVITPNREFKRDRPFVQDRGFKKDRSFGKDRDFKKDRSPGKGREFKKDRPFGKDRGFKKDRPFEKGREFKKSRPFGKDREFKKDRTFNKDRNSRKDGDRSRGKGERGETLRLKAMVDKNRKGFGFLQFEDRKVEDLFVPPYHAEKLFHGDRVEVTFNPRSRDIFSIRVLQHRFREVYGKFAPHPTDPRKGGWVIYEHKRTREEIYIPEIKLGTKVVAEDWVRVKLLFHETGPHTVTGELLDVFGRDLPPSVDVSMIAAEYGLIEEHPEDAEREAKEKTLEIPGKDLEGREDLRRVPFITIDGETARDFDDAVYVERDKSGYILWVGIADVSNYVVEGSALDKDARSRGTSVYFPERAFHMLPRALSEGLCSLRPNEPRLALVAKMHFDRTGKRLETEMMEAVIWSHRRATYNEIQEERDQNLKNKDWEFNPHFELYELIKKARHNRGSIDFDLPEAEVVVKPTGEVVSITHRPRKDAHRLIEEFMIAANEAATHWMMERKWPFVYRVHDIPTAQALEKFETLAATVGVQISLADTESPKELADMVKRIDGHPAQALLNMALLRSMKQAIYSSTHGIHFGLASPGYTHFTSPIRRYPDLVVHRLIRWALQVERGGIPALNATQRERLEGTLAEVCEHCSYRERLAADADREAIKLKQARMMLEHLGDEFDGKIVGMMESGFFVRLEDPFVEGMVSRDSMTDDFYQFNEDRMIFYGTRKKRTFKVGEPVRVIVLKADIDRRQVDFGLADNKSSLLPTKPRRIGT
jgi:ribonuclease R